MANRTVSVALKLAIGEYVGPAEKAAQATDKIGDAGQKAGATHARGMHAIAGGATIAAAAGAKGLYEIAQAGEVFDKAMSGVAAVSDATAAQLGQLRDAAMQAGADTVFSASEAAQAEGELAKAGVSTADILGGALRGSLDLAAAGQLDLGNAATISANAMNIFGLKGSDVASIADTLAAGANKSAADVDQLAAAMSQGGQVASSLGLDLQDTVGVLSMFADAGLKGSDAGTSLKTTLQMLAAPSGEAAAVMKDLGLNAFDAGGNFVGLENFAGQLQTRLSGLTQEQRASALATIFGADAVRAANILYKQGSAGVAEYTAAVNDQGAAGRMAATQLDNLSGDLEALRGSLETALIKSGSGATSMLRGMAQGATGAVNAFANLPSPIQAAATGMLALGTGTAGAIAVLGTAVPRIQAGRTALREMGSAGEFADKSLGKVGKGLAIGTGVLAGLEAASLVLDKLQDAAFDSVAGMEEVKGALIGIGDAAALGRALPNLGADLEYLGTQVQRLADPSLGDQAAKLFVNIATLGNVDPGKLRDAQQNLGAIDQALASLVQSGNADQADAAFRKLAEAAGRGGASVDQFRDVLPGYRDALAGVANDSKLAADGTEKVGQSAGKSAPPLSAMERAAQALGVEFKESTTWADLLKGAIDRLNGASLSALDTDIGFRDSLVRVTEAIKDNGRSVDINRAKGRANLSVISDAIKAASAHGQAVADQTGSIDRGSAAFGAHIRQLRATAIAAGVPRAAVDRLIATYGRVPAKVETTVGAPGAAHSKAAIDGHTTAANRVPKSRATQVSAPGADTAAGKMSRVSQVANGIPEQEATRVSTPGADTAASKMSAVTRAANNIPERETTTLSAVDHASGTISRVSRSLASLDGTRATTYVETIRIGTGALAIGARASGGPVEGGQMYRVNESGAEGFFVPPSDGYVVNHRDFQRIMDGRGLQPVAGGAGRGGAQINLGGIHVQVVAKPDASPSRIGRRVADEVSSVLGRTVALLEESG